MENSTVSGNGAGGSGGGIRSSGMLRLHHCTVASNEAGRAADGVYTGGGLYVTGTAYLMSTIVGDNEHRFESWAEGPNGKPFRNMEIVHTR